MVPSSVLPLPRRGFSTHDLSICPTIDTSSRRSGFSALARDLADDDSNFWVTCRFISFLWKPFSVIQFRARMTTTAPASVPRHVPTLPMSLSSNFLAVLSLFMSYYSLVFV